MVNPTGDSSSNDSKLNKDNGMARIIIAPAKSNIALDYFDSFWLLLNFQECVNIHQVKKHILESLKRNTMQKLGLKADDVPRMKKSKTSLWLHDAILPSYESSHILRDGDIVNLLIKHDTHKKDAQSPQLIDNSNSAPDCESQKQSRPNLSLKRTYRHRSKSPNLDCNLPAVSKKSKKNPVKTNDSLLIENKQIDTDSEDHKSIDKNIVQSEKNKEQNGIGHDSDISNVEKMLITPEIQKLLQQKKAQIEKEPQNEESNKEICQEQKSTASMGDSLEIGNLHKRKRSRRKKKKNTNETSMKNEKPKPPPNYSLNLPNHSSRVVFEESEEEDIVVSSSKPENISSIEKKIEEKKEVRFTSSCNTMEKLLTHETLQLTQENPKCQNGDINIPVLNGLKCSKMKIGIPIDSNAKFSELINRTRRHHHKVEEATPLSVSIVKAQSEMVSAFDQEGSNRTDGMSNNDKGSFGSYYSPMKIKELPVKSQNLSTSEREPDSQMIPDVKTNESIKFYTKDDLMKASALVGKPCNGDIIAFKMMELGPDYTPSLSNFKIGKVLSYNLSSDDVSIELQEALKKRTGRFELVYDNEDEEETEDPEILTSFCMLNEVLLLAR